MLKIACIFSFKESNWVSCQKIVKNLHLSYERVQGISLSNFNLTEKMEDFEINSLASQICTEQPDLIAIMDHKPHPLKLVKKILKKSSSGKKLKFIFHVFGDFTIHYFDWYQLFELLKKHEVKILTASYRQKKLIDSFLVEKNAIVCPFPFNPQEFFFSQERRVQVRQSWKLKEVDKIFVYTGRLSRQKRIKTLLKIFATEFYKEPNSYLYIYGSPDNIGEPFFGKQELEGEYFRHFYSFFKSLDPKVKERIHFKGSVPNSELLDVYLASDIFINLSVHNDEDFGMSVAEAQACGLPSVLTDWGGFASFEVNSIKDAVSFVPVKIGTYNKIVNKVIACKKIRQQFNQSFSIESKTQLALATRKRFSIEAVASILKSVTQTEFVPFAGGSDFLEKIVFQEKLKLEETIYIDRQKRISNLFREIYAAYT
jgi:glycosyltransferase involved in cell wall biosynthesis